MSCYILRQDSDTWMIGFDHHVDALASFAQTPKTPQNTPVLISVPHSSGWGNFEGNFSYVLNSPHPEWARHCVYIDKRGERVEMIFLPRGYEL